MILGKVSLLTILFLIMFLGCEHTKTVLQPVDTIVPLSPDISQSLIHYWRVTTIDGVAISESLSQLQTLIAEHVSDKMNISFYATSVYDTGAASLFRFNYDGTWSSVVTYSLFCERHPELNHDADFSSIENNSRVYIYLSVGGTYIAGYDTEKQTNVLIFETAKYKRVGIFHDNPDIDPPPRCYSEEPCDPPNIPLVFTEDLDWRIFEDEPLSKLFSTPLFDTQADTPVVYTWDMVTSEGTPEDYYRERIWEVTGGYTILPEDTSLISRTIRLYSQGQEDIILRRTDKVLDSAN